VKIFSFDFIKIIKSDKIGSNYGCYKDTIYSEIIINNNVIIISKLGYIGIFPVMVVVGDGNIEILYYIQPSSTNFLTKKALNMKAIIRLTDKGIPTEIKNLYMEELLKGKNPYLDKLLDIQEDSDMKKLCLLQHNNKTFHSYIFSIWN